MTQRELLDLMDDLVHQMMEQHGTIPPMLFMVTGDEEPIVGTPLLEFGHPDGHGRKQGRLLACLSAMGGAQVIGFAMEAWMKILAPGQTREDVPASLAALPPDDRDESIVLSAAAPGVPLVLRTYRLDRTVDPVRLVLNDEAPGELSIPLLDDLPWAPANQA